MTSDPFGALTTIDLPEGPTSFYRLDRLEETGLGDLDRLPFSIRVLLENALRHAGGRSVAEEHVQAVSAWSPTNAGAEVPFMPTRVVLQDFTGVPAVVDLAAMRDGLKALSCDPRRINLLYPSTSSSTTPCRSTSLEPRRPIDKTSSASSSETGSGTRCSDGPSTGSRTFESSPREPASSIR